MLEERVGCEVFCEFAAEGPRGCGWTAVGGACAGGWLWGLLGQFCFVRVRSVGQCWYLQLFEVFPACLEVFWDLNEWCAEWPASASPPEVASDRWAPGSGTCAGKVWPCPRLCRTVTEFASLPKSRNHVVLRRAASGGVEIQTGRGGRELLGSRPPEAAAQPGLRLWWV